MDSRKKLPAMGLREQRGEVEMVRTWKPGEEAPKS